MNLELQGQTAVIVGGAQGIGKATAIAFAEEGANLALLDRSPEVEQTANQIAEQHPIQTSAHVGDITDFDSLQTIASDIQERYGRIDHVVHTAAIGSGKFGFPFWNLTPNDWTKVLEVNIIGTVHVAHAFAPYLVERKAGSLLFFASVAGQMGSQTDPPYSASKAAVINFAQCAAKDLAPHGVRVNALSPGMVVTALNHSVWEAWNRQQPPESQKSYEEWAGEKVKQIVPLQRWQSPEDIASMAVFLASARGQNITGQTINVDGGYVMHS